MSTLFCHWLPTFLPSKIEAYPIDALCEDIVQLRDAWDRYRRSKTRDGIYIFLTCVFELAMWWEAEDRTEDSLSRLEDWYDFQFRKRDDAFSQVIRITVSPQKLDRRRLSKWVSALKLARESKAQSQSLRKFIRRKGGINACTRSRKR